jgi:hypothetical protein
VKIKNPKAPVPAAPNDIEHDISILNNANIAQALSEWLNERLVISVACEAAKSPPVCTENSNSDIMVMQSAKDRVGMDTSSSLNWARERRVLI